MSLRVDFVFRMMIEFAWRCVIGVLIRGRNLESDLELVHGFVFFFAARGDWICCNGNGWGVLGGTVCMDDISLGFGSNELN